MILFYKEFIELCGNERNFLNVYNIKYRNIIREIGVKYYGG